MLKQIKPDCLYFIIRIDEPYAEKVYQVLKEEQTKLGDWPEGNVSYREWVEQTFGTEGLKILDRSKKS